MKKKWFKIMALAGLAAMMTMGLAGCKKSVCEWCGEEKRCKTVYLNMLGDYNMCEDCEEFCERAFLLGKRKALSRSPKENRLG